MLGSTTLIDLKGPRFGAFRGSVRFVATDFLAFPDSRDLGGGDSGLFVVERVVGLSHDWRVSPPSGATELEHAYE